jgi:hypothetical protein
VSARVAPSVAAAVAGRHAALEVLEATGPADSEVSAPAVGTSAPTRLTTRRVLVVVGAAGVVVAFAWLLAEGLVIVGVSVLAAGLGTGFVVELVVLIGQFRARESMEEKTLAEPWSTGELAVLSGDEPPLLAGTGAVPAVDVGMDSVAETGPEAQPLTDGPVRESTFTGRWAEMAAKFKRDAAFEMARIAEVMSGGALS